MKNLMMAAALVATALSTPAYAGNSVQLKDGKQVVMSIGYDPMDSTGIYWNQNLESGNYVAIAGLHPNSPEAWAEWDPYAPITAGLAVSATTGREYPLRVFNAGYINCSPRPVLLVLVEGVREQQGDIKIILLSRRADMAFVLNGGNTGQALNKKKFQQDAQYRKAFVLTHGTSLADGPSATNILKAAFPVWDTYQHKDGRRLKTPLNPEQIQYLKGLNPQYGYGEKLVGTAQVSISMDPISTAMGAVFDLMGGLFAKPKGFDRKSVVGRQDMGYRLMVLEAMRADGQQSCAASLQLAGRK